MVYLELAGFGLINILGVCLPMTTDRRLQKQERQRDEYFKALKVYCDAEYEYVRALQKYEKVSAN